MFFQPEIETMPRRDLEALQLERLKWTVDYCYRNVPFYTKKLDEAGVTADKIKSLADIQYIPPTTKADLRVITHLACLPADEKDCAHPCLLRHNR